MRKAIVKAGRVVNIIEIEPDANYKPPTGKLIDVTDTAAIGGTWTSKSGFVPPVTDPMTHAPTEAARLAAVEKIMIGNLTPSAETPTWELLTSSQLGVIYAGQTFVFEGDTWQAVVGPLNSNATPATYPIGYSKLTGEPAPDAWAVGTDYKVSDRVTYKGHLYTCLTAHTATVSWTPTAAPSLWRDDGVTP